MIDTNVVTLQNPAPSTGADIAKVFQDFGYDVSLSTLLLGLVVVKAVAGYIRNFSLKNATKENSGGAAKLIAHLAGNSLPSQPVVQNTGEPVVPTNTVVAVQPPVTSKTF